MKSRSAGRVAVLFCMFMVAAMGCGRSDDAAEAARAPRGKSAVLKPVTSVAVGHDYLAVYDIAAGSLSLYDIRHARHLAMDGVNVAYLSEGSSVRVLDVEASRDTLLYEPELKRESPPTLSLCDGVLAMDDRGRKVHGDYRVIELAGARDRTFNCGAEPKVRLPFDEQLRCFATGEYLCAPTSNRRELICWNLKTDEKHTAPGIEGSRGRFFLFGAGAGKFVVHNHPVLAVYDPAQRVHTAIVNTETPRAFIHGVVEGGKLVWASQDGEHPTLKDEATLHMLDLADLSSHVTLKSGIPPLQMDDLSVSGKWIAAVRNGEALIYLWDTTTGQRKEILVSDLCKNLPVTGKREGDLRLSIERDNLSRTLVAGKGHLVWVQHWRYYITVPAGK